MLFTQYKGTFTANEPHNLEEEKSLHDEMQELADSTFGSAGKKQTFDMLILIGVEKLNKKHKNINRVYEAHTFNEGAIIYIRKYSFYRNDHGISIHIPSIIAEYAIMHPTKTNI